jgi:hypothetical protein
MCLMTTPVSRVAGPAAAPTDDLPMPARHWLATAKFPRLYFDE